MKGEIRLKIGDIVKRNDKTEETYYELNEVNRQGCWKMWEILASNSRTGGIHLTHKSVLEKVKVKCEDCKYCRILCGTPVCDATEHRKEVRLKQKECIGTYDFFKKILEVKQ